MYGVMSVVIFLANQSATSDSMISATCTRIRQNVYIFQIKLFSFNSFSVMVFNTTFNNISVIWWQSVLTMLTCTDKHYHIMLHRVHLAMIGIQTHNFADRH